MLLLGRGAPERFLWRFPLRSRRPSRPARFPHATYKSGVPSILRGRTRNTEVYSVAWINESHGHDCYELSQVRIQAQTGVKRSSIMEHRLDCDDVEAMLCKQQG